MKSKASATNPGNDNMQSGHRLEELLPRMPVPANEENRLDALHGYDILDTDPEEDFDALTRLASYICEVPISLISLIDAQRQWFKARLGLDVPETPRDISFCQYAILQNDVMEVEDATRNDLFRNNPLVLNEPHIRFYAGAPLVTSEGYSLGTLCVIDTVPRILNEKQKDALQTLAREVVAHLELRRSKLRMEQEKDRLAEFRRESPGNMESSYAANRNELFIKQESRLVKISAGEILWVEALGDYVNIYTQKERYTVYSTMKDMEARLIPQDFARVHRKYIVRIDKIMSIEDDTVVIERREGGSAGLMMNGLMYIPIGNSYKSLLMKRLNLV